MSRRDGDNEASPARRPRGGDRRRPTQAQLLQRQQAILVDRDVRSMSWASIARKHSMGEKEVRETYTRYVREIAPLIVEQAPAEKVFEYLRLLEGTRQRLGEVVDGADNDSARIGGLREIVKTITKEIELLEHAGLMPRNLGHTYARAEHERLLQRIEEVLRRHGVPAEVYEELAETLEIESER